MGSPSCKLGTLYGVGVGPGDPELITVKGVHIIQRSPIVAFPSGIDGKPGIAEQITTQWCSHNPIQLPLNFPYVQDAKTLDSAWLSAAKKVWHYLNQGNDVTFLCEGDISFFSTFSYLAQTLLGIHPNALVEMIPGVCSPMAAAAVVQQSLVQQSQKLFVLPALYSTSDLEEALNVADVIVLMKLKSVYRKIWKILQNHNLLAQSYVVEWATWPQQKIYKDLSGLPDLDLSYFSILIIQRQ